MDIEKKALLGRLETKFATSDTDTGQMTGYGAVFGNVDSYGDIIAPGAFADTLAEHKAKGTTPLMLLNHDLYDLPIGIWDSLEEDAYGLKVAGHFIDNSQGQDAYKTAKAGAITGLSIGFIVTDFLLQNGNRVITGVKLLEVSLVTIPANDLARVSSVKSTENDMKEIENLRLVIEDQGVKLNSLIELVAKMAAGAVSTIVEAKGFQEEGDECDDDEDCEDGCSCGDDDTCECDDKSDEEAGDEEHKYSEAVMSAINQVRRELKSLSQ